MTATSDRIDTSGSSHWYTYPAVMAATAEAQPIIATAAAPIGSRARPTGASSARFQRHGRQMKAAPAPSSSPNERVIVERYM